MPINTDKLDLSRALAGQDAKQALVNDPWDHPQFKSRLARHLRAHLESVRKFAFHKSETFMEYLHGDVPQRQAESACAYEYARESQTIRAAVDKRSELVASWCSSFSFARCFHWSRSSAYRLAALQVAESCESFYEWALPFLELESFPSKDWLALSAEERESLASSPTTRPLPMSDVRKLERLHVFDKFKAMAMAQNKEKFPPVLQSGKGFPWYYALFHLNFSKSETELLRQFKEWLRLPENKQRFQTHKRRKVDTGIPLDRLKDLAAWRLFRELGNDLQAANDFANQHRKRRNQKEALPFRDAKRQGGNPPNAANLFGEESDAYEAQASASAYLAEIMPEEFAGG